MVMTALVSLSGVAQSSGVLVALVGTEVRGSQDSPSLPPFGPYAGQSLFQITLYADEGGETVDFQFYTSSGATVPLVETLTFVVNGNVGNVITPHLLTGVLVSSSPPPPSPPPPMPSPPPGTVSSP